MKTSAELLTAVREGEAATVEELLRAEPSLAGARDDAGVSALLLALYHGHPEVAATLAAGVEALDVWEAAALGDTERLHALLQDDPELARAEAPDGFSPLGLAAFFGRREVVEVLLGSGADPNTASNNAMRVTPLHSAVAHRDGEVAAAVAEALLAAGADPNVRQQGGWTPLHQAAAHGRTGIVDALLIHGAEPNPVSDDGRTPARMAREGGHGEAAERLRRAGGGELA
ncbi:hypothetical protein BH20GEM2_BH20GEM2_21810 [soil metagenome]